MKETDKVIEEFKKLHSFGRLVEVLKHESRFILSEPYNSLVDFIIRMMRERCSSTLSANSKLYRARINSINIEKMENEITPFPADEMGPPPKYLASSGRINPVGISYLYCAGELDTAGAELRPWKGAFLTIGEVNIKKDLTIADLTTAYKGDDELLLADLSAWFSVRWPPELKLKYLVTQYFSEHFKSVGFRGIKYKSDFNIRGSNYALFYKEDYSIIKTYSIATSDISYFFYKGSP